MKGLESIGLFTDAYKLKRLPGDRSDGQRRAPASVSAVLVSPATQLSEAAPSEMNRIVPRIELKNVRVINRSLAFSSHT